MTAAAYILAATLSLTSPDGGACTAALDAQDEVVRLQAAQIDKLKLEAVSADLAITALEKLLADKNRIIAALDAALLREQDLAAKQRAVGRWERFFTGLQYGAVGFGVGVVADRAVWGQ